MYFFFPFCVTARLQLPTSILEIGVIVQLFCRISNFCPLYLSGTFRDRTKPRRFRPLTQILLSVGEHLSAELMHLWCKAISKSFFRPTRSINRWIPGFLGFDGDFSFTGRDVYLHHLKPFAFNLCGNGVELVLSNSCFAFVSQAKTFMSFWESVDVMVTKSIKGGVIFLVVNRGIESIALCFR